MPADRGCRHGPRVWLGTRVSPRSPHGSRSYPRACRARTNRARRASRACAAIADRTSQAGSRSSLVILPVVEVAPDRGRSQKLLDSFGFVESLVDPEPDLGCKFQVN